MIIEEPIVMLRFFFVIFQLFLSMNNSWAVYAQFRFQEHWDFWYSLPIELERDC